jgi:hypothetical protein
MRATAWLWTERRDEVTWLGHIRQSLPHFVIATLTIPSPR